MPVGDVYMTALHFTFQKNANLFCNYFDIKSEFDESLTQAELFKHIDDDFTNEMALVQDVKFVVNCIEVRQVHPTKSIPHVAASTTPAGLRTPADALPGQCNLVVSLFGDANDPTPRNRGRDFWTGAQTADQANGIWDTGVAKFQKLVQTYYAARVQEFTGLSSNVYRWGVFSKKSADLALPFFFPMEQFRLRDLIRTQRRRQPVDPCETFITAVPNLPP